MQQIAEGRSQKLATFRLKGEVFVAKLKSLSALRKIPKTFHHASSTKT